MKRQKLLADTERSSFALKVNEHLVKHWNIVPDCLHVSSMWDTEGQFFSITLWRNGVQTMITGDEFIPFVSHVNRFLDDGYFVVVNSLYTNTTGEIDGDENVKELEQFFFNVVGEE